MSTLKRILTRLKWPLTLILTLSSLGAMASLPQSTAPAESQEKDSLPLILSLDLHDEEGITLPPEEDDDEGTKTEQKAFPQLSLEDAVKEEQKDDHQENADDKGE